MTDTNRSSSLRTWIRNLHLYTGLLISPFVLVFAVSTILLNHTWQPWDTEAVVEVRTVPINTSIPAELERLGKALWLAEQAGVVGEIESIRESGDVVTIPVARPGLRITITANLAAGTARIESRSTAFWDRLIYLHKTPGPHLAGFRGNWVFVRIWRGLVDGTVALLLFSTASGIYLWLLIKAQRRTGLALLGAGALTFVLLVSALTAWPGS